MPYPLSPHDDATGNVAYITYTDATYDYHCFAAPEYNPESSEDLALPVWRIKRQHLTNKTIRILGGGSPTYEATNVNVVATYFA
jgi:hypothetical protein